MLSTKGGASKCPLKPPHVPPLGEINDKYMGKSSYLSYNNVSDFWFAELDTHLEIGVIKYKCWYSRQ